MDTPAKGLLYGIPIAIAIWMLTYLVWRQFS